ncbi:uncharacterized protein M437DRAFT_81164 [Aureobasidium melanogenum CBS 110374]|uniref:MYND-type domain-containing protein n=1 Tax=Aureobasidium melanogenum (strain CBS 110374) TaxID=1043003 RepID=A0A074W558_AURM1|nr:uncharacterized protein M437DRAFT_81164 [Aureobasidium melanogenum CBS 110374]KEQ66684.1 hypothetical protein M437DRAFT_81164 [Aureobasidium melanogenum CBS 110374]
MNITRYRWSDCPHVQHVNDSGQPMGWVEVRDPINSIVDAQPDFDCPACEDPDVTQPGISIMPRVPESTRQSAPAQTTTLNPVVSSFTPSQPMPDTYKSTTSVNEHLAAQQAMVNPYEPAVSINDDPAVRQGMFNPYSISDPYASAFPANHSFDAQQAVTPYASTVLNNDYLAVQQPLDHQYHHQQVYNSAGQVSVPPSYGPTRPMELAGTIPAYGSIHQLATGSIHNSHSPKKTSKPPQHKPGKECPEGHANCHWHYTHWCHDNPATCTFALQAITASFHAHGEWRHAPPGWNEAHKSCIRVENPVMCPFHEELARSSNSKGDKRPADAAIAWSRMVDGQSKHERKPPFTVCSPKIYTARIPSTHLLDSQDSRIIMISSTASSKRAHCSTTTNLKCCAKCHNEWYCSRSCQKTHWKLHKKSCTSKDGSMPSSSSTRKPTASKNLSKTIDKPFHKLDAGTWLHDRSEKDVFKLLIDTFRLRCMDEYTFENKITKGTVQAGEPNSKPAFQKFLHLAESKAGVLPFWWSRDKALLVVSRQGR